MLRPGKLIAPSAITTIAPTTAGRSAVVPVQRPCRDHEANGRRPMVPSSRRPLRPVQAVAEDVQKAADSSVLDGPYNGKKAVIVGAGPGGSLAAMFLAKRGFDVKVFEKRPNPESTSMTVHRSIPMSLNPEVSDLLDDVGIELVQGQYKNGLALFKDGYVVMQNGEVRKVPMVNQEGRRVLTERHSIALAVFKTAISQKLPNLEFVFDSRCEEVDVDSKIVRFSNVDGEIEEVQYDLLIGADGVNSQVREALKNSGHLDFEQRSSKARYVSVRNLPLPANPSDEIAGTLDAGDICFVRLKVKMFENTPGSLVFYKTENNLVQMSLIGQSDGFAAITGREMEYIHEATPSSVPKEWLKPIAEKLQESNLSVIGPVTYCSSYIGPNIALIGDACHSATPTLGIGANRAILDARDLDNALASSKGDISAALHNYDENCRPLVAAIQELEFLSSFSSLDGQNPIWNAFNRLYVGFHTTGNRFLPQLIPQSVFARMQASLLTPQEALQKYKSDAAFFGGTVIVALCLCIAWGLNLSTGDMI